MNVLLGESRAQELPAWADDLRGRDRARFEASGLPHKRLEDWKYTPLDRLADAIGGKGEHSADVDELVLADVAMIRMSEGTPGALATNLPAGVTLLSLPEALQGSDSGDWRTLVEALDSEAPALAMSALNTADLGRGIAVRVAPDTDAGALFVDWVSAPDATGAEPSLMVNARILIVLEAGARLDLVERYRTGGATNVVHQVRLDARSRLRHARLQDNPEGSWLITRTEVDQHVDSEFEQASLDLGAGLARHDLSAGLAETGARCTALGAYLPDGDAHVDHHLDVRHEAVGCSSEQTFRGVLHGRSRAVFNGRVHVLPGADDSEAHQSNQNLLLSREAEVNTKPELIIEADEVVASHGATVGQLDESAVFYLRSRGIDEARARRMLTGAFCRSVVEAIGPEAAREAFGARLEAALEAAS